MQFSLFKSKLRLLILLQLSWKTFGFFKNKFDLRYFWDSTLLFNFSVQDCNQCRILFSSSIIWCFACCSLPELLLDPSRRIADYISLLRSYQLQVSRSHSDHPDVDLALNQLVDMNKLIQEVELPPSSNLYFRNLFVTKNFYWIWWIFLLNVHYFSDCYQDSA